LVELRLASQSNHNYSNKTRVVRRSTSCVGEPRVLAYAFHGTAQRATQILVCNVLLDISSVHEFC
jgi:hypothetical protein